MWRICLLLLLPILCSTATCKARAQIAPVGDGTPGPVKAQHLTAELVELGPAIAPGGAQMVGLVLTIEEHWHVYWINAGDSGEPPHIAWTLPAGITAGPMQFPIPERLPLGPLMDFGYEDEVAFPVRIAAAPTVKPGPAHLDAQITWLVCAQVCIPGKAHLGLDLTVQPGAPPPEQEPKLGALGEAMTLIPGPLPSGAKFSVTGGTKGFKLTLIDGKRETDAEFYPILDDTASKDATGVIANAADQMIDSRRDGIDLYVPRSPDLTALPATLHGVFKLSETVAYEVSTPVTGNPATADGSEPGSRAGDAMPTLAATATQLGLAFLGGIILNLMPCVFPVLFLKGLGLVQTSGQQRATLRRHGLVYSAGILVSFWVIVAALLVLRATGSQIGWGFHLQSPVFVAILASFMFFFALSLAGQFDIGLSLTSLGTSLVDGPAAKEHGYAGSFFTGVLATVVATPCTAPLMGAAVGFALAQPAAITFAIFTAIALGLAAPYVLLNWNPAWVRILPRPGAWMEVLKQITAVPLFATAIWLAWVYGQLHAGDGVNQLALLLAAFLVLASRRMGSRPLARAMAQPHRRTRPHPAGARHPPLTAPQPTTNNQQPASSKHRTAGILARMATLLRAGARCRPRQRPSRLHRLHRRMVPQLPVQRARRSQILRSRNRPAQRQRRHHEGRLDQRRSRHHGKARLPRPRRRPHLRYLPRGPNQPRRCPPRAADQSRRPRRYPA
jgi:DsbC/DsbD-like thiol-disulfide interchange protein/cytochrome c biogenesis protein CcdA